MKPWLRNLLIFSGGVLVGALLIIVPALTMSTSAPQVVPTKAPAVKSITI